MKALLRALWRRWTYREPVGVVHDPARLQRGLERLRSRTDAWKG